MMLLPTTCLHSQYQTTPEMLSFTAPVYLTRLCVFVHVFNVHSPPERRDWPGALLTTHAALGCLMHRLHRNVCWEMIELLYD